MPLPWEISGIPFAVPPLASYMLPNWWKAVIVLNKWVHKNWTTLEAKLLALIQLTEHLWKTEKYLCPRFWFCFAKALKQLAKRVEFGTALIKKHRYWPKDVN